MSTLDERLKLPELPLEPEHYRLSHPQRVALREWAYNYALAALRKKEVELDEAYRELRQIRPGVKAVFNRDVWSRAEQRKPS